MTRRVVGLLAWAGLWLCALAGSSWGDVAQGVEAASLVTQHESAFFGSVPEPRFTLVVLALVGLGAMRRPWRHEGRP